MINSLQLTYEEMEEFLKPSIDYIHLLNTEPAVIRNHIRYPSKDDWHLPMTALESKNDIVYKLLGLNERFCETKLYSEFRRDLVRSFVKNLKCGHVLVNGNYSTLLGNPLEMLYNAIGSWNGESTMFLNGFEHSLINCYCRTKNTIVFCLMRKMMASLFAFPSNKPCVAIWTNAVTGQSTWYILN